MRGRWTRWLGGVTLAALVALTWTQWQADRVRNPGTLLPLAPSQVDRIGIVWPGHTPQHFRRRDGHWWREAGTAHRVDKDERLDRIADLAAAPVQRWRVVRDLDLHTLGLAPPKVIVYLNGQRLDYGVMTPFEPGRYVRVGHRVAVVPAQYAPQAAPAKRIAVPD